MSDHAPVMHDRLEAIQLLQIPDTATLAINDAFDTSNVVTILVSRQSINHKYNRLVLWDFHFWLALLFMIVLYNFPLVSQKTYFVETARKV